MRPSSERAPCTASKRRTRIVLQPVIFAGEAGLAEKRRLKEKLRALLSSMLKDEACSSVAELERVVGELLAEMRG